MFGTWFHGIKHWARDFNLRTLKLLKGLWEHQATTTLQKVTFMKGTDAKITTRISKINWYVTEFYGQHFVAFFLICETYYIIIFITVLSMEFLLLYLSLYVFYVAIVNLYKYTFFVLEQLVHMNYFSCFTCGIKLWVSVWV